MDPCRKDGKKKMRNMDYYGEYAYEINADLGISILRYNGSEESVKKRDELWDYLKTKNPGMYDMINKGFLNKSMQNTSWLGKKIVVGGYAIARKIYGFS